MLRNLRSIKGSNDRPALASIVIDLQEKKVLKNRYDGNFDMKVEIEDGFLILTPRS